jgi:hypothetical protein
MKKDIKSRSAFTKEQKNVLIDLIESKKEILKNRSHTTEVNAAKKRAWNEIKGSFYDVYPVNLEKGEKEKDWDQFRKCWENLVKTAKDLVGDEKKERRKTGGGDCETQACEISRRVVDILGEDIHPLENKFDSDAGHHPNVIKLDCDSNDNVLVPANSGDYKLCKRFKSGKKSDKEIVKDLVERKLELEVEYLKLKIEKERAAKEDEEEERWLRMNLLRKQTELAERQIAQLPFN